MGVKLALPRPNYVCNSKFTVNKFKRATGNFEGWGLVNKKGDTRHFIKTMSLEILFSDLETKKLVWEVSGFPYLHV